MPTQWKNAYTTGDEQIDREHKALFEAINRLEVLVLGGHTDSESIEPILSFLEEYTRTHFAHEEACMARRACPSAQRNREAHRRFIDYFERFRDHYHREGADAEGLLDLHDTMVEWLSQHICRIDIELRDYPEPCARACS